VSAPEDVTTGDAADPPTPVPELSGGAHFPCLDAYRGIGMTMVLVSHAGFMTGFMQRSALGPYLVRLELAVPMFFMLSGFLLYRPFAKAALTERPALATGRFYRRRFLRIIPAYWVALVGCVLLFGLTVQGWTTWLGNLLVAPAFGVPVENCRPGTGCRVEYVLPQAWSIGVEVTFYLALPLYAMVVARLVRGRSARLRYLGLLAGTAVLFVVGNLARIALVLTDPSWTRQALFTLPFFLDLFAVGMAMAVASVGLQQGRALPRFLAWWNERPALCWGVTGLLFLAVTRLEEPPEPFGISGGEYLPRQFAYVAASAFWLWPAIFGDQHRGRLRAVLRSRSLVYLGSISLSFYLWHLAVIEQVKRWTVDGYDRLEALAQNPPAGNELAGLATFTGDFVVVAVLSWLLSFAIASVAFRFVELPFLRLKDEPLRSLLPWSRTRRTGRPTLEGP
jgi:peptidoglycan/LPS O-acetylase OafA/YrhL